MGTWRRIAGMALLAVVMLVAVGCDDAGDADLDIVPEGTEVDRDFVVLTLLKQGIELRPAPNDEGLEGMTIDDHVPEVYAMGEDMKLYMYEFDDLAERDEAMYDTFGSVSQALLDEGWGPGNPIHARLVVVQPVFRTNRDGPPDPVLLDALAAKWQRVQDIVFERINGGELFVYRGSGDVWEGEIRQGSYLHWYEETDPDTGRVKSKPDGYTRTCGEFVYTGDRPEELVDMRITFDRGSSTSISTRRDATDGVIEMGCSRERSAVESDHPVDAMWFRAAWGDQADEFELKRVVTDER